jgi:type III secretion protein J
MKRIFLAGALLALSACGRSDLYSGLSEQHANEMVAALDRAGVGASKSPGKEGSWSVGVARGDFAYATTVLRAADLPRADHESMGDLFRKKGIVSTPVEERARYTFALAQELSQTLSSIDGVQVARVHIVQPERDPIAREVTAASASVLIKHEPGVSLADDLPDIKMLVSHAVQGLDYEDVKVALFEADPVPLRPEPALEQAAAAYAAPLAGAAGLTVLGLAALYRRRSGREPAQPALPGQDAVEDQR